MTMDIPCRGNYCRFAQLTKGAGVGYVETGYFTGRSRSLAVVRGRSRSLAVAGGRSRSLAVAGGH